MGFLARNQGATVHVARVAPGQLSVTGALTFATARRAREAGLHAISAAQEEHLNVDCAAVTESDSAGLAVILDWIAHASGRGCTLRFSNLPPGIRAAARISDVEEIIDGGGRA